MLAKGPRVSIKEGNVRWEMLWILRRNAARWLWWQPATKDWWEGLS
jgi:hypothetical protein